MFDAVTVLSVVGALTDFRGWHVLLWEALVAGFNAIRHFVAISNRNFSKHRLDWDRTEVNAVAVNVTA